MMDPYEQQLLRVFNSHDRDHCGSLDREELVQLCQTLQLEEQCADLVQCLLRDKRSRATFTEFKDALLALLGNMQKNKEIGEKTSPEREVSPKFVYGSKKYGRRSRPRTDEITTIFTEQNDNGITKSPTNNSVQRSNSQTEVSSKKRKTNYKLKRCVSLPGHNDLNNSSEDNTFITSHLTSEPELVCTEEMLREAWNKLGVGKDGYLNQTELVLVCDAIGLQKLADGVIRQLSDKLSLNYDHRISFHELLEALRQDETWFEVLNQQSDNVSLRHSSDNLFPDSRTFQFVTLGPDGNGLIGTDALIEMWDAVGIHSPKELIHELGFNSRHISVVELAEVLEKQIKGLNESARSEFQSPHIVLLQANLTLYQSEIRCFKNVLEQMHAEREKLKCDVLEANNRATMLAQEVDDNHLKMEQNTINQVKLMEQRHADILREVSSQYAKDKEQLNSINQSLEDRILCLENETAKLKNDLVSAQKYSMNLEKENQLLSGKIGELEKDRELLTEQIGMLESEKQNHSELERRDSEMLLAKLTALQIENSQLKDRNDEMVSEIETLSSQMANMKSKVSSTPTRNYNTLDQSMEENISIIFDGVGVGAKRRSDYSPTKDTQLFGLADGSPRLGKVRKCHRGKSGGGERRAAEPPSSCSESGFETEPEWPDSPPPAPPAHHPAVDPDEVTRLRAKVAFLEQVLAQNGIPLPDQEESESSVTDIVHLERRVRVLEKIINDTKSEMKRMLEKDCVNCDRLRNVCKKLEETITDKDTVMEHASEEKTLTDASIQTDLVESFEEKVRKLQEDNDELIAKCSELENCVQLLRDEYEKCEDYWQSKVDEERQFFEAEQKISTEKLTEVLVKMREYEEQYANQDIVDNRLQPIPESLDLEKQFTDLEQEFEDYKIRCENELFKRDEEIAELKEKLTELALRQRKEAAIQVDDRTEDQKMLDKMKNFTSYVIENTSRFSEEMLPPQVPNNLDYSSNTWDRPKSENSENSTTSSLPIQWNFQPEDAKQSSMGNAQSTSSSQNSTPCRPKRTRKHDKNLYKKNNQEKELKKAEGAGVEAAAPAPADWKCFQNLKSGEQTIVLPLSSFHNFNSRKNFLEQRVRHLQVCIRQQHYHNEQTMKYYWNQFHGERADLHSKLKFCQEKLDQQVRVCNEQLDKLQKTDMLVKDLYVENSYLFASVERLEKQCRMLAQCSSNPNSV